MHPYSILIFNDHPDGSQTYQDILQLDGYRVHIAASYEAAIRVILGHQPEVVLIDGDPEGIHPVILGARISEETERRGLRTPTLVAVRGYLEAAEAQAFTKFSKVLATPLDFAMLDAVLRQSVSDWLLRLQQKPSAN